MPHMMMAVAASAALGLTFGAGVGLVLHDPAAPPPTTVAATVPVVPASPPPPAAVPMPEEAEEIPGTTGAAPAPVASGPTVALPSAQPSVPTDSQFDPAATGAAPGPGVVPQAGSGKAVPALPGAAAVPPSGSAPLPPDSGVGQRVVWSKGGNRVWLVSRAGVVVASYPVTDLDEKTPTGQYHVIAKSEMSYADTEEGRQSLAHFVSFFKRCASCSYIGFHAIPRDEQGRPIQPESALGTEQYHSHGCIRQSEADAAILFDFVEVGTLVVVVS